MRVERRVMPEAPQRATKPDRLARLQVLGVLQQPGRPRLQFRPHALLFVAHDRPKTSTRALMAAAVTAEPPLCPTQVRYGTRACASRRCLASSTPTKPTGMPTMAAGRQPSS